MSIREMILIAALALSLMKADAIAQSPCGNQEEDSGPHWVTPRVGERQDRPEACVFQNGMLRCY